MDSSDESFAYCSASSISEYSADDVMAVDNVNGGNHLEESEKSFKKKLQKQLFNGSPSKKRKQKLNEVSADEAYLLQRVKQERAEPVHAPARQETELLEDKRAKKSKKKRQRQTDTPVLDCDVKQEMLDSDSGNNSKKYNPTKSEAMTTEDSENDFIEDKFTAEETIVETRHKKPDTKDPKEKSKNRDTLKQNGKSEQKHYTSKEFVSEVESSSSESDAKSNQRTTAAPAHTRRSRISSGSSSTTQHSNHDSEHNVVNSSATKSRRATKLSDRIRFEDEAAPLEKSDSHNKSIQSSQYRHFLKINPNLKSILPRMDCNGGVTKDEDVWLLKCPREIDMAALKDIDLVLDNKCKIKINGQTYDGITSEKSTIALLSFDHHKCSILNVPLMATINLRKRIPKAHYMVDNIIVNNQTNFIPLPSTKCRHPLFGAHYKKAMKIPAAVKARLRAGAERSSDSERAAADSCLKLKKKKKKHKRSRDESLEPEPAPAPEPEPAARGKRRRRADHLDGGARKAKRNKRDPDSLEAWESEKAIEENLFHF